MKYSVIIPVFNEEENVAHLHQEIVDAMNALPQAYAGDYEIIMIDDGSSDATVQRISDLSPVVLIRLAKNYGQTAAMDAGIKQATGEFVITMDGDGQNPPSEIVKLVEKQHAEDLDVVSGWRKHRKDTFMKKFVSRGANALRGILVKDEIHDSGCSLKIYRRECFDGIDLMGEMHRFIPAILKWNGYSIGEVVVEHRARQFGSTKYNWKRTVKGFVDMVAIWFWRKYATRPLHLFGSFGFILIATGVGLGFVLLVARLFFAYSLSQSNFPLLAVLLTVLGVQFFVSGLLADIAVREYYSAGGRTPYRVKKVTTNQ